MRVQAVDEREMSPEKLKRAAQGLDRCRFSWFLSVARGILVT